MANRIILNETSYFGWGAREVLVDEIKKRGYKKALLVTDETLIKAGVAGKIIDLLDNDVCDPGNWNCKKCFKWCHRDKVVEWLKQPHTKE